MVIVVVFLTIFLTLKFKEIKKNEVLFVLKVRSLEI